MTNAKKITAIILSLVLFITTFVACNKNTAAPNENNTVAETVTDESGEAVTDKNGEAITEIYEEVPVIDENGEVVKDENGETVTKRVPATTNKNQDTTAVNGGKTTTTTFGGENSTAAKPTAPSTTNPMNKPTVPASTEKPTIPPSTTEKPTKPAPHKHKFVDMGVIPMDWQYANVDPSYDGPTNTYEKVSAANACVNCGYWFGSGDYFMDHYYDHILGPNASEDCGGAYSLRTIYACYHLLECSCGAYRRGKLGYYEYKMYFNGNDQLPTHIKLEDWQIKEEGLPMP